MLSHADLAVFLAKPPARIEFDVTSTEDGDAWAYLKGHVQPTPEQLYWATDELGLNDPMSELRVTHTYLAKLQKAEARRDDWAYELRSYDSPGRGRFAATVFTELRCDWQPKDVAKAVDRG